MPPAQFTLPEFALGTGGLSGNPQDKSLLTDFDTQVETLKEALRQFKLHGKDPWIDTALHYGAGNALKAIGIALGETPPENLTLSVKVGRILEEPTAEQPYVWGGFRDEGRYNRHFDYSAEGVRRAFEQSFEFLNSERLRRGWKPVKPEDLHTVVFIHDPENGAHGDKTQSIIQQVRTEALPALARLKKEGRIAAIGVGTNEVACARQLIDHPDLDIAMVAGRLTLLSNNAPLAPAEIRKDTDGIAELMRSAKRYGKKIVCAGPGNSGILYKGGNWYNCVPASPDIMAFREKLKQSSESHDVPLSTAALHYPLMAGANAVVCGACSSEQFRRSLDELGTPVNAALWNDLRTEGLINPELQAAASLTKNKMRR